MNYRHAYHAGNFVDVFKHLVLTRIVEYLKRKEKGFRVIDTHAGAGFYDLSAEKARKTGEWRDGIGRLLDAELPGEIANILKPLLQAVQAANQGQSLSSYPGSPLIARHLLRRQDRLTAIELHPKDAAALKTLFAGDIQARVIELDGWLALGAHVPPKEKRGLVLVDPPFERDGEFGRIVDGLAKAHRRWPGGVYGLWYPIKDRKAVSAFRESLSRSGIPDIFDLRLEIRAPSPEPLLDGCGMIVVNPPFTLATEMQAVLPWLARLLAQGETPSWAIERLTNEGQVRIID